MHNPPPDELASVLDELAVIQVLVEDLHRHVQALADRMRAQDVRLTVEQTSVPEPVVPLPTATPPVPVASVVLRQPSPSARKPQEPPRMTSPPNSPSLPLPPANWRALLREYLQRFDEPRAPADELSFLADLIRGEIRLRTFPADVQVFLLEYAISRLRFLQDIRRITDSDVHPLTSAVASYAKRTTVGFIYGPKRTERPRRGSWEGDAQMYLRELGELARETEEVRPNPQRHIEAVRKLVEDAAPFEEIQPLIEAAFKNGVSPKHRQLVTLTAPFLAQMEHVKGLRNLRRAIREAHTPEEEVEPTTPLPEQWPWFPLTQGKRGVMVGGEAREINRARIEKAFRFKELVWISTESSQREVQNLRDRIRSGGVDFVMILRRFIGHDVDEILLPACRDREVPWISVPKGYGIERIRREIEEKLPRPT